MKSLKYLIVAVALVGCSSHEGKIYLGKWTHTKFPEVTITIEANGNALILRKVYPSPWDGKIKTDNIRRLSRMASFIPDPILVKQITPSTRHQDV